MKPSREVHSIPRLELEMDKLRRGEQHVRRRGLSWVLNPPTLFRDPVCSGFWRSLLRNSGREVLKVVSPFTGIQWPSEPKWGLERSQREAMSAYPLQPWLKARA